MGKPTGEPGPPDHSNAPPDAGPPDHSNAGGSKPEQPPEPNQDLPEEQPEVDNELPEEPEPEPT